MWPYSLTLVTWFVELFSNWTVWLLLSEVFIQKVSPVGRKWLRSWNCPKLTDFRSSLANYSLYCVYYIDNNSDSAVNNEHWTYRWIIQKALSVWHSYSLGVQWWKQSDSKVHTKTDTHTYINVIDSYGNLIKKNNKYRMFSYWKLSNYILLRAAVSILLNEFLHCLNFLVFFFPIQRWAARYTC